MIASVSNRNNPQQKMMDIAATASLLIQDMDYDQYKPVSPFDKLMVPIDVLLQLL
jgi:hypothetical protein